MELTPAGSRVLGCLVEKSLATPQQYPLSLNALRVACNQATGRDPVVAYGEQDVRAGLDDLKANQLVRTEYARGSRTPKSAHRLGEQLDVDEGQQAVLALLLLRGPQTVGELRSRAGRMHAFGTLELVDAVLQSLAAHRFGPLVALGARQPGQKEPRWSHLLGATSDPRATEPQATDPGAIADGPATPSTPAAARRGRHRAFHDAVVAGDWDKAIAQLAEDVVFRSPAVHRPYEGRPTVAVVLRAVARVFEDFRYVDVLDDGDRVGLVFEARVGDRDVQGWDYLRFDDAARITEFTVMIRPLSALHAVVEGMRAQLPDAGTAAPAAP